MFCHHFIQKLSKFQQLFGSTFGDIHFLYSINFVRAVVILLLDIYYVHIWGIGVTILYEQ